MKLQTDNSFISKWSIHIHGHGFTAVPNLLLMHRAELHLSSTEFVVLVAIDSYRWTAHEPWPSLEALSKRCGYTPRTLSRTITSLEEKNVIRRIKRSGTSNSYDLRPLIDWLEYFATTGLHPGPDRYDTATTDNISSKPQTALSPKEYPHNTHTRKQVKHTYEAEILPAKLDPDTFK